MSLRRPAGVVQSAWLKRRSSQSCRLRVVAVPAGAAFACARREKAKGIPLYLEFLPFFVSGPAFALLAR